MPSSILQIILRAINQTNQAFSELQGNLDKTGKAQGSLAAASDKASTGFGKFLATAAKITAAGVAVGVVAKKAWDFGEAGAQSARIMEAGGKVAKVYGQNMDEISEAVIRASLGTVAQKDAVLAVSQAMMFGLRGGPQEFSDLMEIAATRGRAFGVSTTSAFSDIVRGIGRMSPLILDNIGITIDAANTYESYASSIGKAASELTSIEKRQALFNRVLTEGAGFMSSYGKLTWDSAAAFEYAGAKTKNFLAQAGEVLGRGWERLINPDKIAELGKELMKLGVITKDEFDSATSLGFVESIEEQRSQINDWTVALAKAKEEIFLLNASEEELVKYRKAREAAGITALRNFLAPPEMWASWEERSKIEKAAQEEAEIANNQMRIKAGLTGDLEQAQLKYNDAMQEANKLWQPKRAEAQNEALRQYGEDIEDITLNLAAMAGMNEMVILKLSYAFEELDMKSLVFLETMRDIDALLPDKEAAMLTYGIKFLYGDEEISEEEFPQKIRELIDDLVAAGKLTEEQGIRMKLGLTGTEEVLDEIKDIIDEPMPDKIIPIKTEGGEEANNVLDGLAGRTLPDITQTIITYKDTYYRRFGVPRGAAEAEGPGNAFGGGIAAGSTHLVGERGPELFMPSQSGQIIPNNKLGGMGGGVNVYVTYAPMVSTASKMELENELMPIIKEGIRKATDSRIL